MYSGNFQLGVYQEHSNKQDCVIKQNTQFQLDVRSFSVGTLNSGFLDHLSWFGMNAFCDDGFLKVNGKAYCGTKGPHGRTPAAGSELVWHTDEGLTRAGFFICAVSRQPPRP